jgi:cellobiose phosphorylase
METISVETTKRKVMAPDGTEVNASTEFAYEFGSTLAEAVSMFGESVVFSLYKAKATIQVQDLARNALLAGKTSEEAAQLASKHKLGESTSVGKDPVVQGLKALEGMTQEQRTAFILALKAKEKELKS